MSLSKIILKFFTKFLKIIPKSKRIFFWNLLYKLEKESEPELFNLELFIKEKGNAIDVGSNQGIYSYKLSKINKIKRIFSFEPNKKLTDFFQYKINKVKLYNFALSNKNEKRILVTPKKNQYEYHGLSRIKEKNNFLNKKNYVERKIICKKLDNFKFRNVVFIKIDVEGHELEMLEGSRRFFIQNKPNCLIEIEKKNILKVIKFFKSLKCGYIVNNISYLGIRLTKNYFFFRINKI